MTKIKKLINIIAVVMFSVAMLSYSIITYRNMPKIYSKTFLMAGTFITVISPNKDAISVARKSLKANENMLNSYDSESELSKVNALAYQEEVKVSDDLYEFLRLSADAYRISTRVFDISIGPLVKLWKNKIKDPSLELPRPEQVEEGLAKIGYSNVVLNNDNKTVRFKKKDTILDPGGIAKGFMVDKAISAMRDNGIESALINAGGDIYCLGTKFGRPWTVGVNNPDLAGIIETYPMENQAIATSGNYEQFFEHEGKRYSHIIDPRTGWPVDNQVVSVSVIAHNLTSADIFATTFFILGPTETRKFLARNNSNMKVFMIEIIDGEKKLHLLGDVN